MKISAALLAFSLPLVASAQTNVAAAEKLFREAQDAMKEGHYGEACAKFDASNQTDPQLGTLLNLAACREKEGKPASAWAAYTTLVDLASRAGDKDRVDYARRRAAAIEPTLPQLRLRVAADVTLTEVKIDGQALGASAFATTIPIDPGTHAIALATSAKHWTQSVTIEKTGETSLDVRVPAEESATPVVITQPIVPSKPASSGLRTVGLVLGGVGLASLAAGSIFGGIAVANMSTVNDQCKGLSCSPAGFSASETVRATGWASTATFIAGGVLLATGVILYFVGAPKKVSAIAMLLSGQGHFP